MSVDFQLTKQSNGLYDISIGPDGDFALTDNLETSVLVSFFSDARANPDQIPTPERRRGWLGDVASDVPERRYGSWLWLLSQRRLTQMTVNDAVDYAEEALQWMIDDGLVVNVSVSGSIGASSSIVLQVTLDTLEGVTSTTYVTLWERTVDAN